MSVPAFLKFMWLPTRVYSLSHSRFSPWVRNEELIVPAEDVDVLRVWLVNSHRLTQDQVTIKMTVNSFLYVDIKLYSFLISTVNHTTIADVQGLNSHSLCSFSSSFNLLFWSLWTFAVTISTHLFSANALKLKLINSLFTDKVKVLQTNKVRDWLTLWHPQIQEVAETKQNTEDIFFSSQRHNEKPKWKLTLFCATVMYFRCYKDVSSWGCTVHGYSSVFNANVRSVLGEIIWSLCTESVAFYIFGNSNNSGWKWWD